MRWQSGRRSTNVSDRRGARGGRGVKIGGGSIIIALIAVFVFGGDPAQLIDLLGGGGTTEAPYVESPPPAGQDESVEFVSVMLASTEDIWDQLFAASGSDYPEPQLVLFTDAVQSACGLSSSATGPFYCPGDQQIYLDLGFLNELQQLGAPGDFAFAYVIAHEVGHHVQTVTGLSSQVRQLQSRSSEADANRLSVLQELQADCYAGLWARRANEREQWLEEGDLEEGLRAAAAIGDDRLQRMAGRAVQPDAFTHGSSEQRVQWFRTGFQTGSVEACDTFGAAGV